MDIVKRNPAREDWWVGSAPSGPFIYTPFSKGDPNNIKKQELVPSISVVPPLPLLISHVVGGDGAIIL